MLLVLPVLLSFAAWTIPGSSTDLRGFDVRATPTLPGVLLLLLWYGLLVLAAWGGSRLGGRIVRARSESVNDGARSVIAYWVLTGLSLVGVVSALCIAAGSGALLNAVLTHSGNALNEAIGGQAGVLTLRYTPAISAPFGICLAIQRRASWKLATVNLACLVVTAAFSSRLSIMIAAVVLAVLISRTWPTVRVNVLALVAVALAGFCVLAVFNMLRNSNYYVQNGVTNPFAMNWFQVLSYLGAPAQVSITWADAAASGALRSHEDLVSALGVLMPTFVKVGPVDLNHGAVSPNVAENLTTNSVFWELLSRYGWLGLLFALGVYFLLACAAGAAARRRNALLLVTGLVAYCFAEVWRIYLPRQGISVYLICAASVAYLVAWVVVARLERSRGRLRLGHPARHRAAIRGVIPKTALPPVTFRPLSANAARRKSTPRVDDAEGSGALPARVVGVQYGPRPPDRGAGVSPAGVSLQDSAMLSR